MDDAQSAPQGAHYHADVIYLLPKVEIKKGASALWYSELSLHQLGSRATVFMPRWTTHWWILYQVCATRWDWIDRLSEVVQLNFNMTHCPSIASNSGRSCLGFLPFFRLHATNRIQRNLIKCTQNLILISVPRISSSYSRRLRKTGETRKRIHFRIPH